MPSIFAHARPTDFAKPHLNFVSNDGGEDQVLANDSFTFAKRQGRGDEIARVTRISLPIDVVVIHCPDHVRVEKRGIDRIGFEAGNERSRFAPACGTAGHRAVML